MTALQENNLQEAHDKGDKDVLFILWLSKVMSKFSIF